MWISCNCIFSLSDWISQNDSILISFIFCSKWASIHFYFTESKKLICCNYCLFVTLTCQNKANGKPWAFPSGYSQIWVKMSLSVILLTLSKSLQLWEGPYGTTVSLSDTAVFSTAHGPLNRTDWCPCFWICLQFSGRHAKCGSDFCSVVYRNVQLWRHCDIVREVSSCAVWTIRWGA